MMRRLISGIIFLLMTAHPIEAMEPVTFATRERISAPPLEEKILPPRVEEKYEYYEVRGDSEKELRCQLTENGCTWNDGKKYDAVTRWYIKWDHQCRRTEAGYVADSFRPVVEIVFRYPKWLRGVNAPPRLVNAWNIYMTRLVTHEGEHRDMAVTAADQLSRAVADIPPAPSCALLMQEVHRLCSRRIALLNEEQAAFDERTNHGAYQGAVFPLSN